MRPIALRKKTNTSEESSSAENLQNTFKREQSLDPFKIYVGNIPAEIANASFLRNLFANVGEIVNCYITERNSTDEYKYGFVVFKSPVNALNAIQKYSGFRLSQAHKPLVVSLANDDNNKNKQKGYLKSDSSSKSAQSGTENENNMVNPFDTEKIIKKQSTLYKFDAAGARRHAESLYKIKEKKELVVVNQEDLETFYCVEKSDWLRFFEMQDVLLGFFENDELCCISSNFYSILAKGLVVVNVADLPFNLNKKLNNKNFFRAVIVKALHDFDEEGKMVKKPSKVQCYLFDLGICANVPFASVYVLKDQSSHLKVFNNNYLSVKTVFENIEAFEGTKVFDHVSAEVLEMNFSDYSVLLTCRLFKPKVAKISIKRSHSRRNMALEDEDDDDEKENEEKTQNKVDENLLMVARQRSFPAHITLINPNNSEFYFRPADKFSADLYNTIVNQMMLTPLIKVENLVLSDVVMYITDDPTYHRAKLVHVNDEVATIKLIDTGRVMNCEIEQLFKLPIGMKLVPALAMLCRTDLELINLKKVLTSKQKFKIVIDQEKTVSCLFAAEIEMVSEGASLETTEYFDVPSESAEETDSNNEQKTVDELAEAVKKTAITKPNINKNTIQLMHGVAYDANLIYYNSPDDFYVWPQVDGLIDRLDEINTSMAEYDSKKATNKVSHDEMVEGECYAGQFSEDDAWYRVRLLEVVERNNTPIYRVKYIDFGNEEEVEIERLLHLNSSETRHPACAVACQFSGNLDEEELLSYLNIESADEQPKLEVVRIRVAEKTEECYVVDLVV